MSSTIDILEVVWDGRSVGRLAMTNDGLCAFEYSAEFLENGVSISPFELPLESGIKIARREPFDGGFGVFDDSLPDGWGQLVLERYLQKRGINPRSLSLIDLLALVGSSGRGALEFRPDRSVIREGADSDLDSLALEAEHILGSKEYLGNGVEEFMGRGGSPGGARPKIFTKYDGDEWLIKFKAKNDPDDIGKTEYRYSLLARQCGVEMPETRLFEGKYFGVKRFDRNGSEKFHTVSMAGLLRADYRLPSIDYAHIFKVCAILTRNVQELWKVYRLMAFNYLIGNNDDHAKNFAFIYRNHCWHFAPAYDLLPSTGIGYYRTTSINDSVNPKDSDLTALAGKYGLSLLEAEEVLQRMRREILKPLSL